MKIYAISSTEYEGNMPDLFLMDTDGNYYGLSSCSYPEFYHFPKSIDFWRETVCSDDDRYFCIAEVELPVESIKQFDSVTREHRELCANTPSMGLKAPAAADFKTDRAFKAAVKEFLAQQSAFYNSEEWCNFSAKRSNLWNERIRLFMSFSEELSHILRRYSPVQSVLNELRS
jgi:hypothetical protein